MGPTDTKSETTPALNKSTKLLITSPIRRGIKNLKLVTINVQGIKGKEKQAEFKLFCKTEDPDIVFGTESHLDPNYLNNEVFPDTYSVIRRDRNRNGGGVFLAHKKDLIITEIPEVIQNSNNEFLLAKLETDKNPPLFLGVFYRPTDNNQQPLIELQNQIHHLTSRSKLPHLIIGGDFNAPSINWETNTVKNNPQYGAKIHEMILEITEKNSLHQMVNKTTHGKNTLDLLFTTSPDLLSACRTLPGMSKHEAVFMNYEMRASLSKKLPREVLCFNKANTTEISSRLSTMREEFLLTWDKRDVEQNWCFFKDTIIDIIKDTVPSREIKEKTDLPWFNYNIRRLLNQRKRKYKRAKCTNQESDWEEYRKIQTLLKCEIKTSHDKYLSNIFDIIDNQTRSKKLWSYIKSLRRDKVGITALQSNGKTVTSGKEKANILSNHFHEVFTEEDITTIPTQHPSAFPEMEAIRIEVNGVEKLLSQLNVNKAMGPDLIPTRILKDYANIIAPVITKILEQSIESGISPKDWLKANVTAIFKKKGNKINASNYRPISLTCITCKILEHIIFSSIMKHYDKFQILNKSQHGFRKFHSCETQLINTINEISQKLDEKETIECIILDFSKAFDTVPHHRLLSRLPYYGINNKIISWIKNWLTCRTQTVVLDGYKSNEENVKSGVPQGTVLGPLLFLTYINNMCDDIKSTAKLFADDCLLYRNIKSQNDQKELQSDLDKVSQWCESWQMTFNIKKCKFLRISNKRVMEDPYNYNINGNILEQVNEHPYLGIELNNNLCWGKHIDMITAEDSKT